MKQTELSIIIVSYNTADLTIQALNSVFASLELSPNLKDTTEIFVVDNASSDNSVEKIKEQTKIHPNLKLIVSQENLGFAKANNLAAKKAAGEYLLLLNSDTIVVGAALEKLLQTAKYNKVGICAASLLNPDQTHQPQGGSLPNLLTLMNQMLFIDDLPLIGSLFSSTQQTGRNFAGKTDLILDRTENNSIQRIGWVGGTAVLIKKSVWEDVGPLDEKIFMYGEDMELCLRAKKKNHSIAIAKSAQVIHLGSASSSSRNAILGEISGYLYIWKKHYPSWQMPILRLILRVGVIARVLIFGMMGNKDKKQTYLEAWKTLTS